MISAENADPGVVLVHGAYAAGSSWSEVIKRLHGWESPSRRCRTR